MATPNEESVLPLPNLKIVQATFVLLESKCSSLHAEAKKTLLAGIIADGTHHYNLDLRQFV